MSALNILNVLKRLYCSSVMAGVGIVLGIFQPGLGQHIKWLPPLYGQLLLTAIVPYLATVMISRVLHFRAIGHTMRYLGRFLASFLFLSVCMVLIAAISLSWLPQHYPLTDDNRRDVGQLLNQTRQSELELSFDKLAASAAAEQHNDMAHSSLVEAIIPANIYQTLAQNKSLGIVIFSILLALAVKLRTPASARFAACCNSVTRAANLLLEWFGRLQPFIMCCLMTVLFSQMNSAAILASAGFLENLIKCTLLFFLTCIVLVWQRTRQPLRTVLACFRQPLQITLTGGSSFSAIPATAQQLEQRLQIGKAESEAILPIGAALQNYGRLAYYLCAMVYCAQLLWHPSSMAVFFGHIAPAALVGIGAGLGGPELGTLDLAGRLIGLPVEVVILVLGFIELIAAPCRQVCDSCGNLAMTVLVLQDKPALKLE